ncbi:MAG: tetratricopeptide repeat protein, partial [Bacteroidota bacterium]
VDFWAPWCGPCQVLGPVIEKLADESEGKWRLVKVNVDEHQELSSQYHVRGIPAVKLFLDGEVKDEFSGALPEQQIQQWLNKNIPNEIDIELKEIAELIEQDNSLSTEVRLHKILEKEAGHPLASYYLAKLLIFKNPAEAQNYIVNAEKSPELINEALSLKDLIGIISLNNKENELEDAPVKGIFLQGIEALTSQSFEAALEKFIDVIVKNKSYHDEAARKACVAIFQFLGEENDITKKYRRRFNMALY